MDDMSLEATRSESGRRKGFSHQLSPSERDGLEQACRALIAPVLKMPDEVEKIRFLLQEGMAASEFSRRRTLLAVARFYRLLLFAHKINEAMDELYMVTVLSPRKFHKPFCALVTAIFGDDRKRVSKIRCLLRLGFHEGLKAESFVDRIDELGGIEKALSYYRRLINPRRASPQLEAGARQVEIAEVPTGLVKRSHDSPELNDRNELSSEDIGEKHDACIAMESPRVAASPSTDRKKEGAGGRQRRMLWGKGWEKLNRHLDRSAAKGQPSRVMAVLELTPRGHVRLIATTPSFPRSRNRNK